MPRRPAFNAASLYVHFQPALTRTYPVLDGVPGAMQDCLAQLEQSSDGSVAARLAGLKQLVDDDLRRPSAGFN